MKTFAFFAACLLAFGATLGTVARAEPPPNPLKMELASPLAVVESRWR